MIAPKLNTLLATTGITLAVLGIGFAMTYLPAGPQIFEQPPEFAGMPCHILYETDHDVFPSNIVVADAYAGTFVWDSDSSIQNLELKATEIQTINSNSGIIRVITGHGTYRAQGVTEINFELKIKSDGTVEMVESNPSSANFIIDGRHVGTVEEDGTIRARWKDNRYPNRSGTLVLQPLHRPYWKIEDDIFPIY